MSGFCLKIDLPETRGEIAGVNEQWEEIITPGANVPRDLLVEIADTLCVRARVEYRSDASMNGDVVYESDA